MSQSNGGLDEGNGGVNNILDSDGTQDVEELDAEIGQNNSSPQGERGNRPGVLHFFRNMSQQEKEDADRYAAAILELTANNSTVSESIGGWDDSSEITSAFPSLVNVPHSTVESLGHLLRDCDSISNPSELPTAIAELVSVCRERNTRLEEAESVIKRLEDLTEQLLLMQKQQYEALSDPTKSNPLPQIGGRAEDTLGRSSRSSDPPEEIFSSRTSESTRRIAKDPPVTSEVAPNIMEQQAGSDLTVPDEESVDDVEDESSTASIEQDILSSDKVPIQKKDPSDDPPERGNQASSDSSLKTASVGSFMLMPALTPNKEIMASSNARLGGDAPIAIDPDDMPEDAQGGSTCTALGPAAAAAARRRGSSGPPDASGVTATGRWDDTSVLRVRWDDTSVLQVPARPTVGAVWDATMIAFKPGGMGDEATEDENGDMPVAPKPAPKPALKLSDSAPLPQSSQALASSKGPNLDDTMVQTIVAEVMKKLNAGDSPSLLPGSSVGTLPAGGNAVMQVLVRDAKEKLATKNPNDWIVKRLRPPNMEGPQQEPSTIDPPELDEKMPAVDNSPDIGAGSNLKGDNTRKTTSNNTVSSAGAYRVSGRNSMGLPTAAAAAFKDSPPTPVAGAVHVPPVALSRARQTAEDRKSNRELAKTAQYEDWTTGDHDDNIGSLPPLRPLSRTNLSDGTSSVISSICQQPRRQKEAISDNDNVDTITTDTNEEARTSSSRHPSWLPGYMHNYKGQAIGPTDSMIANPNQDLTDAGDQEENNVAELRPNTDVIGIEAHEVPEREANILELTQAVLSLQQEMVRREQQIPTAEVVKTGCQCVIL